MRGLPLAALAALALSLVAPRADAQIVNLLYEAHGAPEGFSGRIAGGGTWLSGNADNLQVQGATLFRYRHDRHLFLAMGSGAYGIAGDNAFIDRQMGHLRYRVEVLGPVQLEAFAQGDRNALRRRVVRAVFGGGPRVEIFDGSVLRTAVGVAYMPEYERFSEGDFPDSEAIRWHHRVSTYLSNVIAIDPKLKLAHTLYMQPAADDLDNLRAFADLSLEVQIWESVSLTLTHSLQLDTLPPASVRSVDADRRLSLAWTF